MTKVGKQYFLPTQRLAGRQEGNYAIRNILSGARAKERAEALKKNGAQ
jgi:hypothetical protein